MITHAREAVLHQLVTSIMINHWSFFGGVQGVPYGILFFLTNLHGSVTGNACSGCFKFLCIDFARLRDGSTPMKLPWGNHHPFTSYDFGYRVAGDP